jgi:transposase
VGAHGKRARVVRRIGVDEKAATKGHCYLTLVCDLAEGTVEPIAEDRTQESLDGYDAGLTQPQLDGIEAAAMDRGEPSLQATRAWVRDATRRSSLTASTSGGMSVRPWTRCASRSTEG